jgi:hypothetical protein
MERRLDDIGLPHSSPPAQLEAAEDDWQRRRALRLPATAADWECEAAEVRRRTLHSPVSTTDAQCAEMERRRDDVGLPHSSLPAELEAAEEDWQRRRSRGLPATAADWECEAAELEAAEDDWQRRRRALGLPVTTADWECEAAELAAKVTPVLDLTLIHNRSAYECPIVSYERGRQGAPFLWFLYSYTPCTYGSYEPRRAIFCRAISRGGRAGGRGDGATAVVTLVFHHLGPYFGQ